MAKATKPAKVKRTTSLRVRVFEDEKFVLEQLAGDAGLNISDFIRRRVFGARAQIVKRARPMSQIAADLIEQLSKIGNNLNQIARAANSGDGIDNRELTLCIAQLRQALLAVRS